MNLAVRFDSDNSPQIRKKDQHLSNLTLIFTVRITVMLKIDLSLMRVMNMSIIIIMEMSGHRLSLQ